MLNSHHVAAALTSEARPKVKITKYMPESRSVASPTTAESTTVKHDRGQQRHGVGVVGGQHGDAIGAEAVEGGGRQRHVARGAGEEGPGRGQRHVGEDVDGQQEPVGVGHAAAPGERRRGRRPRSASLGRRSRAGAAPDAPGAAEQALGPPQQHGCEARRTR